MTETRQGVGVVIGRWQVPEFHAAHHEITSRVLRKHKKVLFIVGVTPDKNPDSHDPLSYVMRAQAIQQQYPTIITALLTDHPSDTEWSKNLDKLVKTHFPTEVVTLYGGRDSFIPHYHGNYKTAELEPIYDLSGTDVREATADEIVNSVDFRKGVIYATINRYPVTYPVVDIALVRSNLVLTGKKPEDTLWRFPGGFIDPTQDSCAEDAVYREIYEESGYRPLLGRDINDLMYISSQIIDDWRYSKGTDNIMSFFYMIKWQDGSGPVKAGDDLSELGWQTIDEKLEALIEPLHRPLVKKLLEKVGK